MSFTSDVIVVGAGIAGASVARQLADAGLFVLVIDQNPPSQSGIPLSTIAYSNTLTLKPHPLSDILTASTQYLTLSLTPEIKKKIFFNPCQKIQLVIDSQNEAQWEALKAEPDHYLDFEALTENEASDLAGIKINFPAILIKQAGIYDMPSYINHLLDHPKIQVIYNQKIISTKYEDGNWTLESKNSHWKVPKVVFTLGAESLELPILSWLPLSPMRGQAMMIKCDENSQKLKTILSHDGSVTPPLNETHYVGATSKRNDLDLSMREEDNSKILETLKTSLPDFWKSSPQVLRSFTGIRATTPGAMPICGQLCDASGQLYPQLYVATGLGYKGASLGPLCAAVISHLILKTPSPLSSSLFTYLEPTRWQKRLEKSTR